MPNARWRARKPCSTHSATAPQLPEEAAVADVSLTGLSLLEGNDTAGQDSVEQAAKVFARRSDERGLAECAVLRARVAIALGQADAAAKLLVSIDRKRLN